MYVCVCVSHSLDGFRCIEVSEFLEVVVEAVKCEMWQLLKHKV